MDSQDMICEEKELLNFMWALIKTNAVYTSTHRKRLMRSRNPNLSNAGMSPRYQSQAVWSSVVLKTKRNDINFMKSFAQRTTPKAFSSIYTIDQAMSINNIFSKLIDNHTGTAWIKKNENNEQEAHICIVKQLFLDCYACDQKLFNALLTPVQRKVWINAEVFFKCFEAVHSGSTWHFFPVKKPKLNNKDNFMQQKLICNHYSVFCCAVMYEVDDELDKENLKKALKMVEKQSNVHLELLADFYMENIKKSRPLGPFKLSLSDFFASFANL